MLAIILAISLFSVSQDTIQVKGTSNINYRIFTNDSNLYFQCKTNKNWTVPITIDKGNISEYAMTATSGDYIHLVWCKDGRVYYKTNQMPITRQDTIRWECNIAISEPELTESAPNLSIYTQGDYIYVNWQASRVGDPNHIEKWRRQRWLKDTPFIWETPENISENIKQSNDNLHSSTNRDPIQMKRVTFLQAGLYHEAHGNVICVDSDHNGLNEIIFHTIPNRWEVWEYRPFNRYELVFADSVPYPLLLGINTVDFLPYDVGDIDGDSLTDLTGHNVDEVPDTTYNIVPTQESPNYHSYPESLSWYYRFSEGNYAWSCPIYFAPDLDNDGRKEIICRYDANTTIFENTTNNQNQHVWDFYIPSWSFAFGDFDQDSLKEFVTAELGSLGRVSVYENTGPDQYEMTYQDTVHLPNGLDVFSGSDLDGDGKPEFFVAFAVVPTRTFYLYMWEATGNNSYQRTLIDQKTVSVTMTTGRRSKCGDIDGNGIDELVWATPTQLFVYKATGNNQFQQVWQWNQDHGTNQALLVNVYDMNNDGYKEIVVGGSGKTSIFEIEAVRVLSPNGGEVFHTDSTEVIRWQVFHPPRCDSLSLFYSVNSGRTYNLITRGLSGNDTTYLWTVPNVNSDSCKIKIIAYGPGWQYDESDGLFRITTTGIEESSMFQVLPFTLQVSPNPAKSFFVVRVPSSIKSQMLKMFDVSGKLVKEIDSPSAHNDKVAEMRVSLKGIKPGVYFIQVGDEMVKEKLVVTR